MGHSDDKFVSRGGLKLAWALDRFGVDPAGRVCVDLGANVGGFTDCLLDRGAARVYAVDTGYGVLDYRLRRDKRVVVMERTNALHVRLAELCDLAVIDLGWTPQRLSLPKSAGLIKPAGRIVSLIKPQYEAPADWVKAGRLTAAQAKEVVSKLLTEIEQWGLELLDHAETPFPGKGGNREYVCLVGLGKVGEHET